jgi:hypothetical protein
MVIVTEVLDYLKDVALQYVLDNVNRIQVGDDGTIPSESDTSIGNLLATGNIEETDVSIPNEVTYTAKFGITSFVGDTVREVTLYDNTNTKILTRNLTVPSLKGADQVFWIGVKVKVGAVNI